jgi:MutS domain V
MRLGDHVISDLKLDTIVLPLHTSWGVSEFQTGLRDTVVAPAAIRKRQLPLMALRSCPDTLATLSGVLERVRPCVASVDDVLNNTDQRIYESVEQILWKPTHIGAMFNTQSLAMNALITWRTILIPLFAVLAPLLAVVVPFFLLKVMRPTDVFTTDMYLEHVRTVLRQQINIPSFLRSKHQGDVFGYVLESVFIGLTLAMFMSGIWSQITAARHTRTIWFDLEARGCAIQGVYRAAADALSCLERLPSKHRRACAALIHQGRDALEACADLDGLDGVAAFGFAWNQMDAVRGLKGWLARLDCVVAIASLEGICFPLCSTHTGARLVLRGVYHPAVSSCVRNDFDSGSGHSLLTGPNRGGKSTYCQSIGLAVVCAQTWGFAWADAMTFTPFSACLTALDSVGTLGKLSTFEAEIEFAKSVLATDGAATFVMMDEIFHSTNAADGLAASQVFLKQLYARNGIVSVISTHYKELALSFEDVATLLYMDAVEGAHGRLVYSYKVARGISEKSSVMEILAERGLLPRMRLDEETKISSSSRDNESIR